jgi:hypothetical protein
MTSQVFVALHLHETATNSTSTEMVLMWVLMGLMVVCEVTMIVMMRRLHRRVTEIEGREIYSGS